MLSRIGSRGISRRTQAPSTCPTRPIRHTCVIPKAMSDDHTLLQLSQQVLDCIGAGDYEGYARLCHPSMSCFEPEAKGHLVEGLPFHEYYFKLPSSGAVVLNTMSSPKVRMMGAEAAVVTYIRLVQRTSPGQSPVTVSSEETRVWQKQGGQWQQVHMHRNVLP